MHNEPLMLAEERLDQIMRSLHNRGTLTVDEIAGEFGVSPDTVRRDFNRLAKHPTVRRTHGGILLAPQERDSTLEERRRRAYAEKRAIANEAAGMIEDHETVVIDAGSTTALMIDEIRARDVTVITYSVEIASRAIRRDNLSVYIAGGAVRSSTASAVGDDTIRMIRSLRASRAFIGANGVSLQHGLMTPNYHEANVKRAIMEIAQINILLLDSSKYDRRSLVRFGELSQIGILITDEGVPQPLRRDLETVVGELRIVST